MEEGLKKLERDYENNTRVWDKSCCCFFLFLENQIPQLTLLKIEQWFLMIFWIILIIENRRFIRNVGVQNAIKEEATNHWKTHSDDGPFVAPVIEQGIEGGGGGG